MFNSTYRLSPSSMDFSVYNLIYMPSVLNMFTEKPQILAFWSHRIERAIAEIQLDAQIYVGFQRMSRFIPVQPQYHKIAAVAQYTWVFGMADVTVPPVSKIGYIDLRPMDVLTQEWFVVVNHPQYTRALVAREISKPEASPQERLFQGVLTSDPQVIQKLDTGLSQLVETLHPA